MAVADQTWAVVSKPLQGGHDTLCNGGIVAGRDRLLAFDSYAGARGAQWVLAQVEAQTARQPTDLVLSHHHGDHVGGLATFAAGDTPPRLWTTQSIRERVLPGQLGPAKQMLANANIVEPGSSTKIDLGGRSVVLSAHAGHTSSDIVVRIDDAVTFYGDLLWNNLFPNYRDASPGDLKRTVSMLLNEPTRVAVPGHGPLPAAQDLTRYRDLLDEIETTARTAFLAGRSPAEAAKGYQLPESLGSWSLFNPGYFETAFRAWHKELEQI